MSGMGALEPGLAIAGQVALLEEWGVTFALCSKGDAIEALGSEAATHRIVPLLRLFPQLEAGEARRFPDDAAEGATPEPHRERDGALGEAPPRPVDFHDLLALLRFDDELRDVFGTMALDVERFAKVRLLRRIADDPDEDGYGIVSDYRASLNDWSRRKLRQEVAVKRRHRDEYFDSLSVDLDAPLPARTLTELLVFSELIDFSLFCAKRWDDEVLLTEYQMLKRVKAVRNAVAHGLNLINGLVPANTSHFTLTQQIRARYGQSPLRSVWRERVRNAVTLDLVTLLWMHRRYAPAEFQRARTASRLSELRSHFAHLAALLPWNHATGYLAFILESAEVFEMT